MMPNPTVLRWFGRIYFAVSVMSWPLTTIISTALAIKLKIPRAVERRAAPLRGQPVNG
jgi:hypothetical protein